MKKYLSKTFLVFTITIWIFTYIAGVSSALETTDKNKSSEDKSAAVVANVGNLENVLLEKLSGKERIHLVVSQKPVIDMRSKNNGSYLIKLGNMTVPESLCRPLGEGELNNIISVTPSQQLIKGKRWVYLTVDIKKIVPFAIRQEGQNLFIDFNIASLLEKKDNDSRKIKGKTPVTTGRKATAKVSAETVTGSDVKKGEETEVKPFKTEAVKGMDRIIDLDFQDADIKSVLRLMAESGNVSIVSSEDVKGSITLSMKNVPWKQALDTILDLNSLTKRQTGHIITVTTLDRKKKDEADKARAADDQNKADDERKAREQKMMAEKGLLKQVLIEAKIVEATEDFVRKIGVEWGFGNQQKVSDGTYGLGVTGGSSTSLTPTQYKQSYPSQVGFVDSSSGKSLTMAAVNFPTAVTGPVIGLVFGGATGFLETQLAALEENGTGKLISAPKVVTMEGIKAIIKQGTEVPYTTPASGTSPATVSFKEALLKLEVTPKITDEGKISMDIKASNDSPDWTNQVQGNPPIKKSEIESKVVISDGDTVVVGGVMSIDESTSVSGWPWLQKIPVLGWLFKTENINRNKKQLLVFVTPRILKGDNIK
ncbi:MAG: secretin and TonB N-terminal domain-containing protein [Smithella sp.]|nr:secretin and TonB N-terminal domain-containing protein [Smithella sp.]